MRVYDASTHISAEFGGIRDLSRHLSLNSVDVPYGCTSSPLSSFSFPSWSPPSFPRRWRKSSGRQFRTHFVDRIKLCDRLSYATLPTWPRWLPAASCSPADWAGWGDRQIVLMRCRITLCGSRNFYWIDTQTQIPPHSSHFPTADPTSNFGGSR